MTKQEVVEKIREFSKSVDLLRITKLVDVDSSIDDVSYEMDKFADELESIKLEPDEDENG